MRRLINIVDEAGMLREEFGYWKYKEGFCHCLAITLHRQTGLPIGACFDKTDEFGERLEHPRLVHAFLVRKEESRWQDWEITDFDGEDYLDVVLKPLALVHPFFRIYKNEKAFLAALRKTEGHEIAGSCDMAEADAVATYVLSGKSDASPNDICAGKKASFQQRGSE